MKTTYIKGLCSVLVAGAAILGTAVRSPAQSVATSITNSFDAANSTSGWTYWYDLYQDGGYNNVILNWESTVNNGGPGGSGSLVYSNIWPGRPSGQWTNFNYYGQNLVWGTFAHTGGNQYDFSQTIDGTKYDSVTFDIRANPGCPLNAAGNVFRMTVGLFIGFGPGNRIAGTVDVDIPSSATSSWYHVTALLNKSDVLLNTNAVAWTINVNCYGGPNAILFTNTTPTVAWIDNIVVNRQKTVNPPPVMSPVITDVDPGLNLFLNNQYDRASVKLNANTGVGWIGMPATTYGFTISKFPVASIFTNNQAHIFIASPNGASSIDYNSSNLVWLNVQGNFNGTATAFFRYKINEPTSNTNLFGPEFTNGVAWAGQLADLTAPTAIGTWTMTFSQDTNVTMTGPGGVSTNFVVRPEVVSQFADPLNVLFGAQPNNGPPNGPPATGENVVLTRAFVTNAPGGVIVDDDFIADAGVLNDTIWSISAALPSGVLVFAADPGQKRVKWSIPDNTFGLQVATNILGPWTTLSGSEALSPIRTFSLLGFNNGLVPSANLGPKQNFFRLFTRKFTKLQVLMPGETAAPGTVTGKTGTPDTQTAGVPFNITVNAVDSNWNPAAYASDHSIQISSNDGLATLPPNGDLTGGTATFSVTFGTGSVSSTVTASDVTDPTKTANTGTPTPVNP